MDVFHILVFVLVKSMFHMERCTRNKTIMIIIVILIIYYNHHYYYFHYCFSY